MIFFLLYLSIAPVMIYIVLPGAVETLNTAELQILFYLLAFFPPVLLYFLVSGRAGGRALPFNKLSFANAGLVLLISFAAMPVMMALSALSTVFFPNDISEMVTDMASESGMTLNLIAIGVMPALLEELIFRGIILRGYRGVRLVTAAFVNGIFFAVMHLGPQQFLYAFMLGFIFVLLVHYTKSIFAPMLAHFTINATQMLLMSVPEQTQEITEAAEEMTAMPPEMILMAVYLGALFLVITGALIAVLIKFNKKQPGDLMKEHYLPQEDPVIYLENVFEGDFPTHPGNDRAEAPPMPPAAPIDPWTDYLTDAHLPEKHRPRVFDFTFWVVIVLYPALLLLPLLLSHLLYLLYGGLA
jgi:membrane protease YdiL (CAAX protease family)